MKKSIRDFDLKGKRVIIRCDLNVPMKNGKITDDNRIIAVIPTIEYAVDQGAKVIILSHLGRPKTEDDKAKFSLKPVAEYLSTVLDRGIKFMTGTRGKLIFDSVNNMNDGDIMMLENTRFEDIDGNKESGNDEELGKYWASLGDIFINDAFGTAHRAHASNVGIATHLPSGMGFLMEQEVTMLGGLINNPERPFIAVIGGAKLDDKLPILENLLTKADYVLIGGAMSHTFLSAMGYGVGKSLIDLKYKEYCYNLLQRYKRKIILPQDLVVGASFDANTEYRNADINDIKPSEMGLDIGEKTLDVFKQALESAKTVFWNGPVGVFELQPFAKGTIEICETLKNADNKVIIGGGDSAAAIIKLGYREAYDHISTGGGASLELLSGKKLPGVEVINNK